MRLLSARWLAAGLVLAAVVSGPASAAGLEVNPLSVTTASYTDVTVANTGGELMRVSVNAFVWTQNPDEPQHVTETDELAYFPKVFTLAPGATQRVRVGVTAQPLAGERAYRLYITELPPLAASIGGAPHLTVLTRVDIPVFEPPAAGLGSPAPRISGAGWTSHGVRIGLTNDGTGHVDPSKVSLTAVGSDGAALWSGTVAEWYVLPHAARSADFAVPPSSCARIHTLEVRWPAGDRVLTATFPNGPCR